MFPGLTIESLVGSGSVMFREAYANVAYGFYDCLLALGVEKVTHTGTTRRVRLFFFLFIVQISFTKVAMAHPFPDFFPSLICISDHA